MVSHLLAVMELGSCPNFTPLYERCGFEVTTTDTLRKALQLCRYLKPDVVVAEFKYGPVYGTRISNLESLFAALQCACPHTRLIVLLEKDEQIHLRKLRNIFPLAAELTFPIDTDALERILNALPPFHRRNEQAK